MRATLHTTSNSFFPFCFLLQIPHSSLSPGRLCFPQSPSLPPIKPSLETLQTRRGSGSLSPSLPLPHISFSPLSHSLCLCILPVSFFPSRARCPSSFSPLARSLGTNDHYYWIVAAPPSLSLTPSLYSSLLLGPSVVVPLLSRTQRKTEGGRERERESCGAVRPAADHFT